MWYFGFAEQGYHPSGFSFCMVHAQAHYIPAVFFFSFGLFKIFAQVKGLDQNGDTVEAIHKAYLPVYHKLHLSLSLSPGRTYPPFSFISFIRDGSIY